MALAGRMVGGYEIIDKLGEGGMAIVYLARQSSLDSEVALKMLRIFDAESPEVVGRFLQEARLARRLSHANIVTVYELFEDGGMPYISMQYLPRGSLVPYVGKLRLAQFAGVMEGILAGLAHAETRGVVHRDLKPDNVLVSDDGTVLIADFGIAMATAAVGPTLTRPQATIGTPLYMAPEQVQNVKDGPRRIGPWTDLYSLGVMGWEILVGNNPFERCNSLIEVLKAQVDDPVPLACTIKPGIDREVSEWIERLLVKDPLERTRSPSQAWNELEEIIVRRLGGFWRREARLPTPSQVIQLPLPPAEFGRTPEESVSELLPGTIVDRRYRVDDRLGSGGMAVVYRATHVRLGKRVALKVISPAFATDQEFKLRFDREARAASEIDNDHVVPVTDYGEDEHGPYIVMRYIEGRNLRQLLEDLGTLSAGRAVQIIDGVGAALDAAHERDVLHRDVKPANILIEDSTGRVYLADFGLARPTAGEQVTTDRSRLMGTEGYMAPERARGEDTSRGDIYSLGCVLWDMLAGLKTQLPGQTMSAPPREVNAELIRVVERATDPRPLSRFPSAGELAGAARDALPSGPAPPDEGEEPIGPDNLTSDLSRQVIELCEETLRTLPTGIAYSEIERVSERLSEPLTLAVIGSRGAGKSTLVSALLGRPVPHSEARNGRVPTRYRYGTRERLELVLHGGARDVRPFPADGSLPDLIGTDRADVIAIDVWLAATRLRRLSIMDVPGAGTLTSDTGPLVALGDHDTVPLQVPDALLFVLAGGEPTNERRVLEAFRDRFGGAVRANAANVIGVLTKADLVVEKTGRWELALEEAQHWREALGALATAVVPVAGKLAAAAASGRVTHSVLVELGSDGHGVGVRELLGAYGERVARELAKSNLASPNAFARELREASGIEELNRQMERLQLRSDILKADAALVELDDLSWQHPDQLTVLRDRIDHLRLHGQDMHLLEVMREFDKCANGEVKLGDGMLEQMEQLLTGRTVAERLGLSQDADAGEQRAAVVRRVRQWRGYVNSGLAGFTARHVADKVLRSFEMMADVDGVGPR